MKECLAHHIIMASAGTGKTFALTGRLVRLLASGVPLERIVALTFTRAAAGEIFDALVSRLALAAADPARAAAESARIRLPVPFMRADFGRLLADVLARMHLSPIGTLDSFFVRMVRLFPFEFGLNGDFTVLDGHAVSLEIQHVLRSILAVGDSADDGSLNQFIEAFKRATFGAEEKRLHDLLAGFVTDYHSLYLNVVDPDGWGDAARIWAGQRSWWQALDGAVLAATVEKARDMILASEPSEPQLERWQAFLDLAAHFEPGSMITKPGDDLLLKLVAIRPELTVGAAEIVVQRRHVSLSAELGKALLLLIGHVVACSIESRLQATRGVRDILRRYEREYDARVRRPGKLTFADVAYVIGRNTDEGAPSDIEFRLDGRYDHWAIDEFQDTSRRQWLGVAPLVDEVVQDAEGQRSFFAVGDVKQAIYGWRGGDSALLREIGRYYGITESSLTDSYRCGPAVIQAVNAVFSTLGASGLPPAVTESWAGIWQDHHSACPDRHGVAMLTEVRPEQAGGRASQADWHRTLASTLLDVLPWERGLSAAVLVRSNAQGEEISEYLRSLGVPAVWSGAKGIADNPAVCALLDLLRVAQHPGDTLGWEHLRMTPLGEMLAALGLASPHHVGRVIMRDIYEHGFAFVIEGWTMKLEEHLGVDAFTRRRLRSLLDAAEAFDRDSSRSCLDFIDYVDQYTVSDVAAEHTVQVMTIHRSKGLGFDVVLLPLPSGRQGLDGIMAQDVLLGPALGPAAQNDWVLLAPGKDIAMADAVLAASLERASYAACFGELCVLYVGMTRAKRALYLFVPPAAKKPGSVHLHTLVRARLNGEDSGKDGPLAGLGEPRWFDALAPSPTRSEAASEESLLRFRSGGVRRRHPRRTPSRHRLETGPAAELFAPTAIGGLRFGTALHGLMQDISWLDDDPLDQVIHRWRRRGGIPLELAERVERTVRRALGVENIRREFERPDVDTQLWRERSFELILDGQWVSGTFDRVVFGAPSGGVTPAWARITDFKSDRIASVPALDAAVLRYGEQIRLYRRALACLIGLPEDHIEGRLLFTDATQMVVV